ncbi:type II toxin-antitoxin system antitoxin SocA domain-containing protein [Methanosphaerula subterraneus]|uniref:type II toxin-antitoxin system antitoxin SocA domain-containing protein n=1 Tax=Methanosphaerula subterraneus TaxID=3350244 RepID=UPI003F8541EB
MPLKKLHSLLYAMEQVPDIGKTKLVKFIFLADLISINQRGIPIFPNPAYIRMPMGPVDQFAFLMAGESNAFFSVTAPKAIIAFNGAFHPRGQKKSRKKVPPQSTKFTPRVKADPSYFSTYEKVLFDSVLKVLRYRTASEISNITHHLRLWEDYNDGDVIPIGALKLDQREMEFLRSNGFFFDCFTRQFCQEILRDAEQLKTLVAPLDLEHVNATMLKLDQLIRTYPVTELESFYDAYLSWDDTYRLALTCDPTQLPPLAEMGSEALCTYVIGKEMDCVSKPELDEFAESFICKVETIRYSLLEQCKYTIAADDDVQEYVERAMRISCDIALNH